MAIMEMGPAHLEVSSNRQEKQGIKPGMPGLQGEWFILFTSQPGSCIYHDICSCIDHDIGIQGSAKNN